MIEKPVVFKSGQKQIIGILHLPKKKKPPLIIMCHGWSANKLGTWSGLFVQAARNFCKSGFAVLRFDFIGSGDSEGDFKDQTITTQLRDLRNVIDQIVKRGTIDPNKIGIVGHSKGAEISLICGSKDKRIKCIASWASPAGTKELWSSAFLDELYEKGYIILENQKITIKNYEEDIKYNFIKIIKKIKCPVLIIGCDNDCGVPPSQAKKIYKNINSTKKLFIIKNCDHYFSNYESKNKLIKLTLNWFKKHLK